MNVTNNNKKRSVQVSEYLALKDFENDRLWSIDGEGQMSTVVNREKMTAEQFKQRYPVPVVIHFNVNSIASVALSCANNRLLK